MHRLLAQRQRLHGPEAPDGCTGCGVIEVGGPSPWAATARAWRGVQADLDLPAPAIAVSGHDAYQLWFAFAPPAPEADVTAFLAGVRDRYLADLPPARVRLHAGASLPEVPRQVASDQWSAYVAPDLAPVFDDTPGPAIPPGDDGQADLLAALRPVPQDAWAAAVARLATARVGPGGAPSPGTAPAWASVPAPAPARDPAPSGPDAASGTSAVPSDTTGVADTDPRRFLQRVMNDSAVPLALRIQAATALLAHPATSDGPTG